MAEDGIRVEARRGFYRGCFDAMASPCELLCDTDSEAEARELTRLAAREAWRIESKFSRFRDDNLVHRINTAAGKPVELDGETARLVGFAAELHALSDGLFDISSGVLSQVWHFDGGQSVPKQSEIDAVLECVGWHRARWEPPVLRLPAGMQIDLGGIGKEYAVDQVAALARQATPASCLVNLGGDLAATRASLVLADWKVGIEAISGHKQLPAELIRLRVGALATSGDSRRFVMSGGERLGHILDPRTGRPVQNAPRSVTVAADTCTQAGMLATLAMLQGSAAETFLDAQNVSYWCARSP